MPPTKRKAAPSTSTSTASSSKELVELDHWFRVDLRRKLGIRAPASLQAGDADHGATKPKPKTKNWANQLVPLDRDDLTNLMRWKLARGKFRPRLIELASSNPTTRIHSVLAPLLERSTPSLALVPRLSTLRGIGPATSSALLSLYRPRTDPFLSDEAWTVFFPTEKPEYTEKAYKRFREVFKVRLEEEGWGSAEELEMACWSWAVREKYGKAEEDGTMKETEDTALNRDEPRGIGRETAGEEGKRARRKTK
ncbi:BZ3501_MvSof-1269-A2-R1_Chr11g03191 [Microbotryum saponariae]|nr:BZ3501_MvSof-1269-A2-R1_Chr11g03191 [Microbotryum saponariae]